MERLENILNEIEKINGHYDLSCNKIYSLRENMKHAKLCMPVIGEFSAGKSALMNRTMGIGRLLRENITPQTAFPTEIVYTEDGNKAVMMYKDGKIKEMDLNEFRDAGDPENIDYARVYVKSENLSNYKNVMLVDMPGFSSGYKVHNVSIDNYLPRSLGYIIVFASDNMVLTDRMKNILSELKLNNMPVCLVITKMDKVSDMESFDAVYNKLVSDIKRVIGTSDFTVCRTSADNRDISEFNDYLENIEKRSEKILSDSFKMHIMDILNDTESYITARLNSSCLTLSELDEQEDKLNEELENLEAEISKMKAELQNEISYVRERAVADIKVALNSGENTFVNAIMNNQNIDDTINSLVRNSITNSMNRFYNPLIKKFVADTSSTIDKVGEFLTELDINDNSKDKSEKNTDNSTVNKAIIAACLTSGAIGIMTTAGGAAAATGAVTAAGSAAAAAAGGTAATGSLAGLLNPVAGFVLAAIAGIAFIFSGKSKEQKLEEEKENVRNQLRTSAFPKIIASAETEIDDFIRNNVGNVEKKVGDALTEKKQNILSAINSVRDKANLEKSEKAELEAQLKKDLDRIGELKNEL